jgi:hypothetical protein
MSYHEVTTDTERQATTLGEPPHDHRRSPKSPLAGAPIVSESVLRARRNETENTANRAVRRSFDTSRKIAQGTLALEPIAVDYAHRAALRAGPLSSNPPNRPSRHRLTNPHIVAVSTQAYP